MKLKIISAVMLAICFLVAGCAGGVRAKGGNTKHVTAGGAVAQLAQPENPKDASKQDLDVADWSELAIPAGTKLLQQTIEPDASGAMKTNVQQFTFEQPATLKKGHTENSKSQIGAAQKDMVGETIAKLKSAKIFVFIGLLICLGGVAFAVYPPLQLLAGGFVPGAVVAGVGLVIAVLPYFVIGNEKLFAFGLFAAAAIGAGAIWIHKHGGITAELATLKNTIHKI